MNKLLATYLYLIAENCPKIILFNHFPCIFMVSYKMAELERCFLPQWVSEAQVKAATCCLLVLREQASTSSSLHLGLTYPLMHNCLG